MNQQLLETSKEKQSATKHSAMTPRRNWIPNFAVFTLGIAPVMFMCAGGTINASQSCPTATQGMVMAQQQDAQRTGQEGIHKSMYHFQLLSSTTTSTWEGLLHQINSLAIIVLPDRRRDIGRHYSTIFLTSA